MFVKQYCATTGETIEVNEEKKFFARNARKVGNLGMLIADVCVLIDNKHRLCSFGYSSCGFSFLADNLPSVVFVGSANDSHAYFKHDGMLFYMNSRGRMFVKQI